MYIKLSHSVLANTWHSTAPLTKPPSLPFPPPPIQVREKHGVNAEDSTTEVIGRIIPTRGRTPLSDIFLSYSSSEVVPEVSHRGGHVTRAWHSKRPPSLLFWACVTRPRAEKLLRSQPHISRKLYELGYIYIQNKPHFTVGNVCKLTTGKIIGRTVSRQDGKYFCIYTEEVIYESTYCPGYDFSYR